MIQIHPACPDQNKASSQYRRCRTTVICLFSILPSSSASNPRWITSPI